MVNFYLRAPKTLRFNFNERSFAPLLRRDSKRHTKCSATICVEPSENWMMKSFAGGSSTRPAVCAAAGAFRCAGPVVGRCTVIRYEGVVLRWAGRGGGALATYTYSPRSAAA